MPISTFYICLFCWLLTGVLHAQQPRAVMLDIPSAPLDYANLQDPKNPFSVIKPLVANKITVLPPPRAVSEFCANNFELIYPVVDKIKDCNLDLIKIFSIEAVIYANTEFRKVVLLGLRNGFEYDLKEIKQWLPLMQQQSWLNSDAQMLKMLASGRLDAIMLEQLSAQRLASELDIDLKSFKRLHHPRIPIYIGVNSSRPDLSIRLHKLLENGIAQ